jgi:DNA (cytosine-5)-methyltransferase 1
MATRCEWPQGFGAPNIIVNRHLLGDGWDTQLSYGRSGEDWDTVDAQVVLGNPPCSGFSTLTSTKGFRGNDSPINDCMWALIHYAARVKPEVVIFESVQQAFRQGIGLMRDLRSTLEEESGHKYDLYHVLHNNASLGGASIRKRYFFVASRVPFGVERVTLDRVPSFRDLLHDLAPLGLTWEQQPYRGRASWWSAQMHDGTGLVDGHEIVRSPTYKRARFLIENVGWDEGETVMAPTRRYYEKFGDLPRQREEGDGSGMWTERQVRNLLAYEFRPVPNSVSRWLADYPARVITGGACHLVLHPWLPRTLTHREAARIQGFPDAWRIEPLRHMGNAVAMTWGKGIPVHSGRWVARWAKASIEGSPGSYTDGAWPRGLKLKVPGEDRTVPFPDRGEREHIIDVTNDWKTVWARQHS